jgi:2',3'-cyclic-nucleotide 2'-phosphodiesterase (5'-nucleotidase family)
LFYTFYGGEKIADVMNIVEPDAFTLGNHEFDAGEEVLGEFVRVPQYLLCYVQLT